MTRYTRNRLHSYHLHDLSRTDARPIRERLHPSAPGLPKLRGPSSEQPQRAARPVTPSRAAPGVDDSAVLAGAPGDYPAARQSRTGGPGPAQAHVGTDDEQPVQATSALGVSA